MAASRDPRQRRKRPLSDLLQQTATRTDWRVPAAWTCSEGAQIDSNQPYRQGESDFGLLMGKDSGCPCFVLAPWGRCFVALRPNHRPGNLRAHRTSRTSDPERRAGEFRLITKLHDRSASSGRPRLDTSEGCGDPEKGQGMNVKRWRLGFQPPTPPTASCCEPRLIIYLCLIGYANASAVSALPNLDSARASAHVCRKLLLLDLIRRYICTNFRGGQT